MYVDLVDQNDDFCKQCTYPVGNKCSVCCCPAWVNGVK
jgi:hypothetical protein